MITPPFDYKHDRMVVSTDHKTFNDQTNCIMTGNIVSNTMIGSHVRAWYDQRTLHWKTGEPYPPGEMFAFDIERFVSLKRYPSIVKKIKELAKNDLWVYEFFHFNGRKRVIHGYVVTDYEYNHLASFVVGPTEKSYNVICQMEQCVSK